MAVRREEIDQQAEYIFELVNPVQVKHEQVRVLLEQGAKEGDCILIKGHSTSPNSSGYTIPALWAVKNCRSRLMKAIYCLRHDWQILGYYRIEISDRELERLQEVYNLQIRDGQPLTYDLIESQR